VQKTREGEFQEKGKKTGVAMKKKRRGSTAQGKKRNWKGVRRKKTRLQPGVYRRFAQGKSSGRPENDYGKKSRGISGGGSIIAVNFGGLFTSN